MNTFNQNSEHNLRNRMNSHEFDFDPSAWDDMEQLLDKKKPRGGTAWYFSFPLVAIGITTLTLAVFLSNFTSTPEQSSATTNDTVQSTTVQNMPTTNAATSTILTEDSEQEAKISTPNVAKKTITNSTNKTTTTIETATTIIKETRVAPTKNISKKTAAQSTFFKKQLPMAPTVEKNTIPFSTVEEVEVKKAAPTAPIVAPVIRFNEKTQEFELLEEKEIPLLEIEEQEEKIDVRRKIAQGKINVGLLVGTSFTSSANGPIKGGTISPTIGAFVNYDINDKLSLQIEALVKPSFASTPLLSNRFEDATSLDSTGSTNNELYDYTNSEQKTIIELPVTVKYKVNNRNAIFAGIRPTLIRTKQKIVNALNQNASTTSKISTRDDIALSLGVERQLTKKVSMDVRYSQGLIDQDNDDDKANLNSDLFLALKYAF